MPVLDQDLIVKLLALLQGSVILFRILSVDVLPVVQIGFGRNHGLQRIALEALDVLVSLVVNHPHPFEKNRQVLQLLLQFIFLVDGLGITLSGSIRRL